MRLPGRFLAFAVMLAAIVSAGPASADAAELARARELFAEGVKRFQKGDYEGARRFFEEADRMHHSPSIDYNLALASERLGHLQAAVEGYERYLTEAGEEGEFAQAAAIALAQLRARGGRLLVTSDPSGARIFVNGVPIRERTPTTVLVAPGQHLVVVEGEDFRASADVSVESGESRAVSLRKPPDASKEDPPSYEPPAAPGAGKSELSGLVWGASFQIVPHGFFARNQPREEGASGIFVGLSAEAGFAFTSRAVIGLRASGALGSECKYAFDAHIASVGPMLALRATDAFWIGAGLFAGNGETCRLRNGGVEAYSTDIVFSPVLDLSYAVTSRRYGQWLVSIGVGYFFATPSNDNRLIYAPVGFGPRFF